MTDQPAAAPTEQPQPLNNYKVTCLNGVSTFCASPLDLMTLVKFAIADGGIPSDKMFIVWGNICTIEYVGPYVPGQTVTPFTFGIGPKLVP